MNLERWKLKTEGIVYELWFESSKHNTVEKEDHNGFLIICHGCPSHPFDHNPALLQDFISEGYVLVYPRYIGTWESEGKSTLENAVDTLDIVNKALKEEKGEEIRHGKQVTWKYKKPVLIGASFGGSVVLIAGAKIDDFDRIVSLCPVIDFKQHNNGEYKEEDLSQTWKAIQRGWKNLWRIDKTYWERLQKGRLDLNPADYLQELSPKKTLIFHGKKDAAVNYQRSKTFHQELKERGESHSLVLLENKTHMGTFELGQPKLFHKTLEFLQSGN